MSGSKAINKRGQINFTQLGIGGILKLYRLGVPANQREYAWSDTQVTTLFRDLAKAISDGEPEYFLGTIVTIPRSVDSLEVVDGQQRLATVAVFLSQIRNYLQDKDPLIVESINNEFITAIDREKRERVPKLQLNLDDNEFFRNMITEKNVGKNVSPRKPSHRLIRGAFEQAQLQIKRIVSTFDPKDHGDVLNKWIQFIEHGAQVILLQVPSDVNAYKMFETLNDRGLKTSQADLVKNYLFGQADARLPEASQKWSFMRGALESLEEEDATVTFLRHALIAIRGYLREYQVYEAVQASARGSQASVQFLNLLEGLAQTYVAIFNPEHEAWNTYPDSMRRAIQTLNVFNIKPMRPLMLAVASKLPPKEANEAFRLFITWGVRLMIASSTRSGSVEEPLAATAQKVFAGEIETATALKKAMADVIPADEQFRQAFEVATVSKAILARYYLRSLEMAAKNEATPWFIPNDDRQTINLEHVLPERFENEWGSFDEDGAKAYVKRIGNLALLLAKSNSDLRSADFKTKRSIYKKSPYELTRQISTVSEWTEEKIAERQKGLAELALRAWPL